MIYLFFLPVTYTLDIFAHLVYKFYLSKEWLNLSVKLFTVNIAIFDSTDYPSEYNHIIVVKSKTKLLVPYDDRTHMRKRFYRVSDSKEVLTPFTNNLKGFVDNWKI